MTPAMVSLAVLVAPLLSTIVVVVAAAAVAVVVLDMLSDMIWKELFFQ